MRAWKTGLAVMIAVLIQPSAEAHEVRTGSYQAQPGALVTLSLTIDTATDLASLHLQLNYDPNILTFHSATNTPGSIGAHYSMAYAALDGAVSIVLASDEAGPNTGGCLAEISFQANPGAEVGMYSDLILAECDLGRDFGGDLATSYETSRTNGKFWVVFADNGSDSDGDGLSDYAEQMVNGSPDYDTSAGDTDVWNPDTDDDEMPDGWEVTNGLDPVVANANLDSDGDGHSNIREYTAGTIPTDASSVFKLVNMEIVGGRTISWLSVSNRTYSIYRSTNLLEVWSQTSLTSGIPGDASGQTQYTDPEPVGGKCFYSVKTEN